MFAYVGKKYHTSRYYSCWQLLAHCILISCINFRGLCTRDRKIYCRLTFHIHTFVCSVWIPTDTNKSVVSEFCCKLVSIEATQTVLGSCTTNQTRDRNEYSHTHTSLCLFLCRLHFDTDWQICNGSALCRECKAIQVHGYMRSYHRHNFRHLERTHLANSVSHERSMCKVSLRYTFSGHWVHGYWLARDQPRCKWC